MGGKPSWWFDNADKVIHATMFGVLSLLLLLAFRKTHRCSYPRAATLAFLLTVAYGASDEIHQFFTPNRTPDFADLAADAVGASLSFLACIRRPSDPCRSV